MIDSRVFVCVSTSDFQSLELLSMLPAPISSGQSRMQKLDPQKFPQTHFHLFDNGRASSDDVSEQVIEVVGELSARRREFAKLRRTVPFHIGLECHYPERFTLTLSTEILVALSAVGASVDMDLYWNNDEAVESLPSGFRPTGVLQVSGAGWEEPLRWDSVEWGHLVAGLLRRHQQPRRELTFRSIGGYGRPLAVFSKSSIHRLARHGGSLRIIVEPGWPLVPNPSSAAGSAS